MSFDPPDFLILSHPRSGTHFLQSSLGSHPKIHGRGECVLKLVRSHISDMPFIFNNRPNYLNAAIIMYGQVEDFEHLCGSLDNFRIIHLLRQPIDIALSIAQMHVDRKHLKSDFEAHHRTSNPPPKHFPISLSRVKRLHQDIKNKQEKYIANLKDHPALLSITYEELTNNNQVTEFPEEQARKILTFLGLEYFQLTTTLRKTAPDKYVFSS